jgi:FecR protein
MSIAKGPENNDDVEDALGRLLRLAGPRQAPPTERATRVEAIVRAQWRAALRRRRQRLAFALGGMALAATLLAALLLESRRAVPAPIPVTPVHVGVVAKLDGPTTRTGPLSERHELKADELLFAGTALETSSSSRAALRLLAGPSVRLDHETRLRLTSPSELTLEAGAIYVDSGVLPSAQPIAVRTVAGLTRDIGTQFEVRVVAHDAIRIRVREGRVQLTNAAAAYPAEAGEELNARAGQIARGKVSPYAADWRWILPLAPTFQLEGAALSDFLKWSCRENGWTCTFARSEDGIAARRILLHGSIQGLDPDQALDAVLPTAGFTRHVTSDVLLVERAAETK